ncbi:MAG: DUF523 domain-containing protein [Ruminococcaceae bacterium]|nr:DUF523 domain-containing protein [Oscillospiraceae bacterium]
MNILLSACLLGVACRYDGRSKAYPMMEELCRQYHVVPVCPEIMGGLPTPRTPAERLGDRVITKSGGDVTENYDRGAQQVLQLARTLGCTVAVLKERSPSCGSGQIYDGTFTGMLTDGWGVAAQLLRENGIRVLGESQLAAFLEESQE